MRGMNDRERFEVPADAPVVLHHVGREGRPCVAVIVEAVPEGADPDDVLAAWRLRIGRWVSRADAADTLGLSVQRVDQLRREGRLKARKIGGVVAFDVDSLMKEVQQREEEGR